MHHPYFKSRTKKSKEKNIKKERKEYMLHYSHPSFIWLILSDGFIFPKYRDILLDIFINLYQTIFPRKREFNKEHNLLSLQYLRVSKYWLCAT